MKNLAFIAALLIAGCTSISQSVRSRQNGKYADEKIARLERQCEETSVLQANASIARIVASGDNLSELEIKNARAEGDRAISKCRADADREGEKIARRNIAAYRAQAQEERERSALMATLTSSRAH